MLRCVVLIITIKGANLITSGVVIRFVCLQQTRNHCPRNLEAQLSSPPQPGWHASDDDHSYERRYEPDEFP